jgi:FOG: LysM repeat
MTVDFIIKENASVRIRKRRRRLENGRRNRVVRVTRIPVAIILICLLTGMAGYIGASDGKTNDTGLVFTAHAEEQTIYKNIVVKNGDTLWGIASKYMDPSKDIRKEINDICKLNDITPGSIYPGQVLKISVPAHLA